jgi:hypothetical protein
MSQHHDRTAPAESSSDITARWLLRPGLVPSSQISEFSLKQFSQLAQQFQCLHFKQKISDNYELNNIHGSIIAGKYYYCMRITDESLLHALDKSNISV